MQLYYNGFIPFCVYTTYFTLPASDGDDYKNNVNKGFMKVTLSFIILQLLQDNRLNGVDFEINIIDNAKIIINDQLRPVTDLYKDFFNDSDRENKIEKFKLFTASNRDSDIEYIAVKK